MRPLRELVEVVLERAGVLRPKAEVIDLSDLFASRELRWKQAKLVERDLLFGPPDDEPPRSA